MRFRKLPLCGGEGRRQVGTASPVTEWEACWCVLKLCAAFFTLQCAGRRAAARDIMPNMTCSLCAAILAAGVAISTVQQRPSSRQSSAVPIAGRAGTMQVHNHPLCTHVMHAAGSSPSHGPFCVARVADALPLQLGAGDCARELPQVMRGERINARPAASQPDYGTNRGRSSYSSGYDGGAGHTKFPNYSGYAAGGPDFSYRGGGGFKRPRR